MFKSTIKFCSALLLFLSSPLTLRAQGIESAPATATSVQAAIDRRALDKPARRLSGFGPARLRHQDRR